MGTRPVLRFLGSMLMLGLWSLSGGRAVDAHDEVSFLARRDFRVGHVGPVSVTVGDFNGDGRLDLATANRGCAEHACPSCWARAMAPSRPPRTWRWETVLAPSRWATSMAMAASIWPRPIEVPAPCRSCWARAMAPSRPPRTSAVGTSPRSVTVGDFNGDGRLDLATANGSARHVSILLGQGDGTFQAAQDFGGGSEPVSVTVGDFNGDGRLDLATANVVADSVSILLGQGDGTFGAPRTLAVGAFPGSVTVGDFNGDGRLDLATANGECRQRVDPAGAGRWHLRGRPGLCRGTRVLSPSRWATSMAMAASISPPPMYRCQQRVDLAGAGRWHLRSAPRTLAWATVLAPSRWATSMAMAASISPPPMAAADSVSILLGQGDGTFAGRPGLCRGRRSSLRHGGRLQWRWPPRSRHRQWRCQQRVDLAGAGRWHLRRCPGLCRGRRSCLRHGGRLQWRWPPRSRHRQSRCQQRVDPAGRRAMAPSRRPRTLAVGASPHSVTVGDFNGDGHLDLATANVGADSVSILLGQGDGTFQAAQDVGVGDVSWLRHGGRLQWRWPPRSGHGQ